MNPQARHIINRKPVCQLAVEHNAGRTALLQDISQTRRLFARADWHGNRAYFLQRIQNKNKLGLVADEKDDAVATLNALRSQARRDARDFPFDFR
jgi:hypothetical protein